MKRLAASRHVTYFEVLSATGEGDCPVCHLGLRAVHRYLDGLSYEGVNDPGLRAALRSARGFCNHHAWQFANEIRDGLGIAIIYRDVLATVRRAADAALSGLQTGSLASFLRGREGGAWLADRLAPTGACPACRCLAQSSQRYLDTLLAHLADPDLKQRYARSPGLCLPHLAAALPRVHSHDDLELLLAVAARRVAPVSPGSTDAAPLAAGAVLQTMVGSRGAVPARPPVAAPDEGAGPLAEARAAPCCTESPPQAGTCHVCQAAASAVDGWLADVGGRGGREPGSGLPCAEALALCNAHAWRLAELAPQSAVVAVWAPAARAVQGTLRGEPSPGGPPGRRWQRVRAALGGSPARRLGEELAAGLQPGAACPACSLQAAAEQRLIAGIVIGLQQSDAGIRLPAGSALCLPHLELYLRRAPGGPREQLLLWQVSVWRLLESQLDEYIRKQDRCALAGHRMVGREGGSARPAPGPWDLMVGAGLMGRKAR